MKKKELFKINLSTIVHFTIVVSGCLFTLYGIIVTFVPIDEYIKEVWIRALMMVGIILISFILSILYVLLIAKEKVIWGKGKNKITASYDDLLSIGFNNKKKEKRIIVIPVNDTFDTIVEEGGENTSKPLVSPNSIHGMWINRFCEQYNTSPDKLNSRILDNLELQGLKPVKISNEKEKGNKNVYDLGSVAVIDAPNNTTYYLLAISIFDSDNKARSNRVIIRDSIEKLLSFYDKEGQGYAIYIPLMGTGRSRANISHEMSFKIIRSCTLTQEKCINGEVNIVVYKGDKDKVSIFK